MIQVISIINYLTLIFEQYFSNLDRIRKKKIPKLRIESLSTQLKNNIIIFMSRIQ